MGEFNITLKVSGPHDFFISYAGLHTLFLKAGDSLYLIADERKFEETLRFSGDNAQSNRVLALFFKSFGSLLSSQGFHTNKRELPPLEYKKFVSDFFAKTDSSFIALQ